jgi:hypothetical protein
MLSLTVTMINVTLKSAVTDAKTFITMGSSWYFGSGHRSKRRRWWCRCGSPFLVLLCRETLEECVIIIAAYIDHDRSSGTGDDGRHWWQRRQGHCCTLAGERGGEENDEHELGKEHLHVETIRIWW